VNTHITTRWLQIKRAKENLDPIKEDIPLYSIEASRILEVAEWPEYEKTGLWHSRVARVLREAGHLDEAITSFEKALKLDDSLWLAQGGLAISYAARGEYEKALETMKNTQAKFRKAAEEDPEMDKNLKSFSYDHYKMQGEWNMELGNTDGAIEQFKGALKIFPRNPELILRLLVILHDENKYQEIMDMLEEMRVDVIPETGFSRLVEVTQRYAFDDEPFYSIVVHSARETGRLEFVKDNIVTSLKAARKDAKVGVAGLLQFWLGLFTYRHHRDVHRAVHIWEQIMETSFASQTVSSLGYARIMAAIQLSIVYFDKAVTAGKGTIEADLYIHKLENLSKQRATDAHDLTAEKVPFVFSTRDTTLVLGLLYRLFGNDKEARECFRSHIKLGNDFLTDDDPTNDWQGFMKLADVLNFADDIPNLDASYSLLGPRAENLKEDSDSEDEGEDVGEIIDEEQNKEEASEGKKETNKDARPTPLSTEEASEPALAEVATEDATDKKEEVDDLEGDMSYGCDGICNVSIRLSDIFRGPITDCCEQRHWSKPDPLHMCRYCLNIAFCDDCIKLVKSDELPFLICSPKHEFYDVPKVTKRLTKGMVLFKGEEIPVKDWLDGLRKQWDF